MTTPSTALPAEPAWRGGRRRAFAATWLAYAAFYLCRKNLSVAKGGLMADLGLDKLDLGAIDFAYLACYAVGQLVSGLLGDRIGGRRLITGGLLATAALNAAFAAGSSHVHLVAVFALNGFAQSAGWPGCAKALGAWFARRERGTAMALWCTCYQVGPVVATLLATFLLQHHGWRAAFAVPALIVGSWAVLFSRLQPAPPETLGIGDVEEHYARLHGDEPPSAAPMPTAGPEVSPLAFVLTSRPIWTLALTYVALKFIRYSFLFWLPLYLSEHLGYGSAEAGYTSTIFDIAGFAGVLFAGFASDRIFAGRRAPIVVIMMLGLAASTTAYASLSADGRLTNAVLIALIGFLVYGPDSVTSGVSAIDFGSKRAAAMAAGFINGLGSIGGAASPLVIGWVSERHGWEGVMGLFGPCALAGALLMTTMWNRVPDR